MIYQLIFTFRISYFPGILGNPKIQDSKNEQFLNKCFVLIEISDFPAIYLHFKHHKMRKLSIEGNTARVHLGNRNYSVSKFSPNFHQVNLDKGAGKTTVLELLRKLNRPDWKLIDEPVAKWREVIIGHRFYSH